MVKSINNQLSFDPKMVNKNPVPPERNKGGTKSAEMNTAMDTVTLSQDSAPSPISTHSVSPEDMADKSYEVLRKLVTNMLKEQGINFEIATDSATIDITQLSQEEALELVAEDGYFGVKQTSDRIADFAIAAAGGDVSKLDAIKEGVQNGFNEALDVFGGSLPEISHKTLAAVMEKLDAWAAGAEGKKAKIIG